MPWILWIWWFLVDSKGQTNNGFMSEGNETIELETNTDHTQEEINSDHGRKKKTIDQLSK